MKRKDTEGKDGPNDRSHAEGSLENEMALGADGQGASQEEIADGMPQEEMDPRDARIAELEASIGELTDQLLRSQAEFENFKKRYDKEKAAYIKYVKEDIVKKVLPVIDSMDMAFRNSKGDEEFHKGMRLIYNQLLSTLAKEGLRPIDAMGKQFDPYYHEVMMKEKSDKEPDTVIGEIQKGYMLNENVIRHSKVKIASGN